MSTKNKNQSRQSLSSMKESPAKGLKNVLANPQELTWTVLKNEKKKKELDRILEELLPKRQPEPRLISWAKLRKMSKKERLELKKNLPTKSEKNKDDVLNSVIFGINATTKALEKDIVGSILLDSTVDPLFMIRHVVLMAQKKSIPVILIPSLKTITLEKLGFAAAAMALKKFVGVSEDEYFYILNKKIADLNKEFPKTTYSLHALDKKCSKKKSKTIEVESDLSSSESSSSEAEESAPNFNKTSAQSYILPPGIYKYRTSRKERVFIPPTSEQQLVTDVSTIKLVEEQQSAEFFSLNVDIDMIQFNESAEKVVKKRRYMGNLRTEEDEKEMKEKGSSEEEVGKKQRKENLMDHDVDKVAVQSGSAAENLVPKPGHSSSGKLKMVKKTPGIYLPLKVKQVQKNPNRVRATKAQKIKKKNAKKK